MRAVTCALTLLLGSWSADSQAQEAASHGELARWARKAAARGNRVAAEQIDAQTQQQVLEVLAKSVAACDCLPRRIRWVWPLANPQAPNMPKLVVSFDDRPRDARKLVSFERYALLQAVEDAYHVTSAFNVGRPNLASGGTLRVQLKPRRDLDGDGELDISLTVAELWPDQRMCGVARFQTSQDVLKFEETECEP